MHLALSRLPADDDTTPSALTGILCHLDDVYGFALTLAGDAQRAADLTEDVFTGVDANLWSTLGGHGLRERLLARCVIAFTKPGSWRGSERRATPDSPVAAPDGLRARLFDLPWDERAAIALVDQLGLSYAASAAVLGIEIDALRVVLHRGRSVLLTAYQTGTR